MFRHKIFVPIKLALFFVSVVLFMWITSQILWDGCVLFWDRMNWTCGADADRIFVILFIGATVFGFLIGLYAVFSKVTNQAPDDIDRLKRREQDFLEKNKRL